MLECVVNLSEGRDGSALDRLAAAAGDALLDLHRDPHHHRSVLTLVGEEPVRAVAEVALATIDLRAHRGVHPRLGAVDVVPFVALGTTSPADALAARDRFARWWGARGVPCFLYGPQRSLPEVRRGAFTLLRPDTGPSEPHPSAGATAAGARPPLVAYNVWLAGEGAAGVARRIAREIRGPRLRALGLELGSRAQVSMNLVEPSSLGPEQAFDLVAGPAERAGVEVVRAELVGLVPESVLAAAPRHRWRELDLGEERTIEARAAELGIDGAR